MLFCYIDESGDCGPFHSNKPENSGSPYFILSGLVVSSEQWKTSLDLLKAFRKKIAREAFLPYDIEFHCAEMIDPHKIKEFRSISVSDRWKLIEEYAETIGSYKDRANEKHINTHVRKLLRTGASGESIPDVRIDRVIEDPIFRASHDSIFIQTADVIAYTLKEKEFPQASRQKHQAHKIFERKLSNICYKSKIADEDGIVRQ